MGHIKRNIFKFYSKLEDFWNTEKYTDVTIECTDGSFKCHRLALAMACDYFDTMFGGQFAESAAETIRLPTINAEVFEQVLKFIYTGDAVVSSNNICGLLKASELFQLTSIEDLCVQFLLKNETTVENILEMFAFARLTSKHVLIHILSRTIVDKFEMFYTFDKFLEIPMNDLKFLLNRFPLSSVESHDSLLDAIIKWIQYCREERLQYVGEFSRIIRLENVLSADLRSIFEKFIVDASGVTAFTQIEKPIGYHTVSELSKFNVARSELGRRSLHVFLDYEYDNRVKVFSINSARGCSISTKVFLPDPGDGISITAGDSYLYRWTNSFCHSTFCAYTSVSMCSELPLRSPPLTFMDSPEMCALKNTVYVYNRVGIFHSVTRTNVPSLRTFDDDEICRGIYAYNYEVDGWFPLPKMKERLCSSSMAVCNNILYLIGGRAFTKSTPIRYAQAYDCRTGEWRELPKTNDIYCSAIGCAVQEKIYVYGSKSGSCERYDPVAGKWENIASICYYPNKAVSYLDQLWTINDDLSVNVYDPTSNTSSEVLVLEEADQALTNMYNYSYNGCVREAFVF